MITSIPWTDAERLIAAREDLSIRQAAQMTGRTYHAVAKARTRIRRGIVARPREITSEAVTAAAGISYRQLDHWTRRGYLRPAADTGNGPGHCREWSSTERAVACLMAALVRAGLEPQAAALIARSGRSRFTLAPGIMIELHPDLAIVPDGDGPAPVPAVIA
jgi:hypothetical protein